MYNQKNQTMKKALHINMYLAFIFSFSIFGSAIYAQERYLKTELLVYVLPDSLELPEKEKGLIPITQAGKSIKSGELQTALATTGARHIGRAFPAWPTRDSIAVRSDGELINTPSFHRIFIVTFDSEQEAESAISTLSKLPSVKFAEKHAEPVFDNDPSYLDGTQWYLNNDGRLGGVAGGDINAETAWGIFTGSPQIKIAIMDKGIDLNHIEFEGRVSGDSHSGDDHGTLVAGVAAANAMNGEGMRGVDWNAQIISKKVSAY